MANPGHGAPAHRLKATIQVSGEFYYETHELQDAIDWIHKATRGELNSIWDTITVGTIEEDYNDSL